MIVVAAPRVGTHSESVIIDANGVRVHRVVNNFTFSEGWFCRVSWPYEVLDSPDFGRSNPLPYALCRP